jgi:hypothetical protein
MATNMNEHSSRSHLVLSLYATVSNAITGAAGDERECDVDGMLVAVTVCMAMTRPTGCCQGLPHTPCPPPPPPPPPPTHTHFCTSTCTPAHPSYR